jgi:hypothetical protein
MIPFSAGSKVHAGVPEVREANQQPEVFKAPQALRHQSQKQRPHAGSPREFLHEDLMTESGSAMPERPMVQWLGLSKPEADEWLRSCRSFFGPSL